MGIGGKEQNPQHGNFVLTSMQRMQSLAQINTIGHFAIEKQHSRYVPCRSSLTLLWPTADFGRIFLLTSSLLSTNGFCAALRTHVVPIRITQSPPAASIELLHIENISTTQIKSGSPGELKYALDGGGI